MIRNVKKFKELLFLLEELDFLLICIFEYVCVCVGVCVCVCVCVCVYFK